MTVCAGRPAIVARNPKRHATRVTNALLDEHYIGATPTQSELEEAMFALTRRLRLPDPQINRWIGLGDGEPMILADFVWFEQRVIVETDGHRYHGPRQARERDRRRDQRRSWPDGGRSVLRGDR